MLSTCSTIELYTQTEHTYFKVPFRFLYQLAFLQCEVFHAFHQSYAVLFFFMDTAGFSYEFIFKVLSMKLDSHYDT